MHVGSERVKKSGVQGIHMKETTSINSSLMVLGKVISSLSKSEPHVPYYECKLTTLLKSCFGGNSRTSVVISCRSDDIKYGDETLQSLRFGERCSMISNSVRQVATSKEDVERILKAGLEKVTAQIESLQSRGKQNIPSYNALILRKEELVRRLENIASIK